MADSDSLDAFLGRRDAIFLPVLAGLLGTSAIVMAVMWLADIPVLHADAQRAEATVTKLERISVDVPGSRMLHDDVPVVRFQDGPRQVEVRVTNANHRVGKFSVGQKVTVVYRAGRPEEARIPSFFEFYLPPLAIGGVGIIFDLIAMALFTAIRRKRSAVPTGDTESGV